LFAALGALLGLGACIQDEPVNWAGNAQNPSLDGAQEGQRCDTTADCAGRLRCLRLEEEAFCVTPCTSSDFCTSGLCRPVQNSTVGWCDTTGRFPADPEGDGNNNNNGGPAPEPTPDNNWSEDGNNNAPDPIEEDEDDPTPPDPIEEEDSNNGGGPPDPIEEEDDPAPPRGVAPGGACACDADCAAPSGFSPLCVEGICMAQGSQRCAASGSSGECPQGSRCWSGSGVPICYPDCDAVSCDGTCDGDGSCVSRSGQDCYASCGRFCNLSGQPNGGNGGNGGNDDPAPDPNEPQGDCGTATESEQFRLMNADRVQNGLPALRCHEGLVGVAHAYSEDMATRGFFSHTDPEGRQPWDRVSRAGIQGWSTVGENIAYGQRTPSEVQQTWMNSWGHRANILSRNYTHIGVGAYNDNGTWYWTQVFAAF
jgi:hypothetical protein